MTVVDLRRYPELATVESDICIIGAGPAGIAIANEIRDTPHTFVLLESGGLNYDAKTQELAKGDVVGIPYPPLHVTRLRYLGGTSNHWGGNIRPLDPHDFEYRPWIPHSGWPIGFDDMAPFYERAKAFCGIPSNAFDLEYWGKLLGTPWQFDGHGIVNRVFHTVGPQLRFGKTYREVLHRATNVTAYLHANVTELIADEHGQSISHVKARTLEGKEATFSARVFVLAAGGIENARLLLLSDAVQRHGLGNSNDLVGRYFMEHLTVPEFATFIPANPQLGISFYRSLQEEWGETWGVLCLSPGLQEKLQLSNFRFQLAHITNSFNKHMSAEGMVSLKELVDKIEAGDSPDDIHYHIAHIIADIDEVSNAAFDRIVHYPDYPLISIKVVAIGEQTPNPASRVYLGNEHDALGQRQAVLDWNVTEADSENIRQSAKALAHEVGRAGLGRLVEEFPDGVFAEVDPGPHIHHMGTTRMSDDPRAGVVDSECQVHGIDNLFVAGSSVFPTVGNVNPTFTIIALAIRLGDHLRARLS